MKVAVHQPNYLPWPGYFAKMLRADLFVFIDGVPFSPRSYTQRCRISGAGGTRWLTVPVKRGRGRPIAEVRPDDSGDWRRRHLETLRRIYGRGPHFGESFPVLEEGLSRDWDRIADLNIALIDRLRALLGISTPLRRETALRARGRKSELLLEICREAGASTYLSGPTGRGYLDLALFRRQGIEVRFFEFGYPARSTPGGDLEPGLSVVDALFRLGGACRGLLEGGREEPV